MEPVISAQALSFHHSKVREYLIENNKKTI